MKSGHGGLKFIDVSLIVSLIDVYVLITQNILQLHVNHLEYKHWFIFK